MASMDDLPACILHYILVLLSIRDAARTSVLSNKWRNLWKQLESYELDGSCIPDRLNDSKGKFRGLAERVIFSHSGPGIKSLKLSHSRYVDGFDSELKVTGWLYHLASGHHRLERLDVDVGTALHAPPSLFRCATLVDLRMVLRSVAVEVTSVVRLPRLRRLCLEKGFFRSAAHFQQLIDGCPSLERLELRQSVISITEETVGVDIRSPTLRHVGFDGCGGYSIVPFEISAPNLEEFVYSGLHLATIKNGMTRLAARKVSLSLDDSLRTYLGSVPYDSIDFFANLGRNMARIMSGFHSVIHLGLSGWTLEYLSRIVDSINLPVWKLEVLTIMGMWPNQGHAGIVLHLVQRSPRLHDLFITNEVNHPVGISTDERRRDYPKAPDFQSDMLAGRRRHSHLRRFFMLNFTGNDHQINIVRFVRSTSVGMDLFRVTDAYGQDCSAGFL